MSCGGVGRGPEGREGHVTFPAHGPDQVMEGRVVGHIADPEGYVVGAMHNSA